MRRMVIALGLLALPSAATAQVEVLEEARLPRATQERLEELYRAGSTTRYRGDARVEAGTTVRGDVAAEGGTLVVAGRIEGSLLVLNGDVIFEPGGSVAGDVTVVGGETRTVSGDEVGGTLTVYGVDRRFDVGGAERRRDRERDEDRDEDWDWLDDWRWPTLRGDVGSGEARLTVRLGETYNRVEGLPLRFGPVVETEGPNPIRLQALATYRTETGAEPAPLERWGYAARVEQFLGGKRVRIGASAFSEVRSIESWQVSDLESSLSTLLFHDDPRDHVQTMGWSAFVALTPRRAPVSVTADYRLDDYATVAAADPWTVFGDDWRPQPLAAEGTLRSVGLAAELADRRHIGVNGWRLALRVRHGLGGSLERPGFALTPPGPTDPIFHAPATEYDERFTAGLIDARRYGRVGRNAQLALRVVAGGSLDEGPLPPQFQHVLGGVGGLAAFDMDEADCGARAVQVRTGPGAAFHPAYGCDRIALGQLELRGGLDLDMGWITDWDDGDDDWRFDDGADASWVVFMDVGRGWTRSDLVWMSDTGTMADAGIGLRLGGLGAYWAVPVTGDDRGVRFLLRLGRRF